MKSTENSNIFNDIIKPSNNKKNNTIDFKSLCSMNDNNMSTIDKKIKTKYSSALNYVNTLTDKKITIPTSSSIKNHKIEKLRSEMLSSIINNIHSSRYKTNANKKVSNGNHNRNNSINMSKKTKNYFTKKMKNILALPKEKLIQIRKKQINKFKSL
jgi:hypothetical protein